MFVKIIERIDLIGCVNSQMLRYTKPYAKVFKAEPLLSFCFIKYRPDLVNINLIVFLTI